MKKLIITAFIGIGFLGFSQDLKSGSNVREKDKTLLVKTDHAELEAKKRKQLKKKQSCLNLMILKRMQKKIFRL